jgi:hypothetical protein
MYADIKWKKQYVMFELNRLSSDIWYWENTISYPEELINLVNRLESTVKFLLKKYLNGNLGQLVIVQTSSSGGAIKMIRSDSVNI